MPYTNIHRGARISPTKVRPVIDMIRGKQVEDAIASLQTSKRRAAVLIGQSLNAAIVALREQGERVIQALPGQRTGPAEHDCDRRLELIDGRWQPTALTQETSAS
jgi:ATP phosphoribosyltransferase regulatory subunit